MGDLRVLLSIAALVLAAGCSSPPEPTQFETGLEYGQEIIEGDRSSLPSCEGDGFCSNAIVSVCALEPDQLIRVCVESPSGDRSRIMSEEFASGRVSPSGTWLLSWTTEGDVLIDPNGGQVLLDQYGVTTRWLPNDRLLARTGDGVLIIDVDQNVIETIPHPDRARIEASSVDISADGKRLLFFVLPDEGDSFPERELWIHDLESGEWSVVYDGDDFVNLSSRPGFGVDDTTVIVQLSDARMLEPSVDTLRYRVVSIDLESNDVTTLEETFGPTGQFSSVSPDGRFIAVAGANLARVLDTETGKSSPSINVGGSNSNSPPSWSYDSQFIVLGLHYFVGVQAGDEPTLSLPVEVIADGAIYLIDVSTGS